jgi:hypothetical protein
MPRMKALSVVALAAFARLPAAAETPPPAAPLPYPYYPYPYYPYVMIVPGVYFEVTGGAMFPNNVVLTSRGTISGVPAASSGSVSFRNGYVVAGLVGFQATPTSRWSSRAVIRSSMSRTLLPPSRCLTGRPVRVRSTVRSTPSWASAISPCTTRSLWPLRSLYRRRRGGRVSRRRSHVQQQWPAGIAGGRQGLRLQSRRGQRAQDRHTISLHVGRCSHVTRGERDQEHYWS